jgi:hypothetical protein
MLDALIKVEEWNMPLTLTTLLHVLHRPDRDFAMTRWAALDVLTQYDPAWGKRREKRWTRINARIGFYEIDFETMEEFIEAGMSLSTNFHREVLRALCTTCILFARVKNKDKHDVFKPLPRPVRGHIGIIDTHHSVMNSQRGFE